jgi:hypothetical protein
MSIKRSIAVVTIACLGVTGLGAVSASASPPPKRHPGSHVVSVHNKAPKIRKERHLQQRRHLQRRRHLQQLRHRHGLHTHRTHPGTRHR